MINCKDAMVTLCVTKGGSEMFGDNWKNDGYLITNKVLDDVMVDLKPSQAAGVFGFGGIDMTDPKIMEVIHWINAIINDTEPT